MSYGRLASLVVILLVPHCVLHALELDPPEPESEKKRIEEQIATLEKLFKARLDERRLRHAQALLEEQGSKCSADDSDERCLSAKKLLDLDKALAKGLPCRTTDLCSQRCLAENSTPAGFTPPEFDALRCFSKVYCALSDAAKVAKKELGGRGKFSGSLTFGLNGDETGAGREEFKVDTGVSVSGGSYPGEFAASWNAQLRFDDGEVEEDVTRARFHYDYYARPWLETFAFAERTTDSFLSVDQRWEVGFGTEFEFKSPWRGTGRLRCEPDGCRGLTQAGQRRLHSWYRLMDMGLVQRRGEAIDWRYRRGDANDEAIERAALDIYPDTCDVSPSKDSGKCEKERRKIAQKREAWVKATSEFIGLMSAQQIPEAIRNRYARIEFGLGIAVFQEFENIAFSTRLRAADLSALTASMDDLLSGDELAAVTPTEVSKGTTVTRLSIRPSMRFRPADGFHVRLLAYYKMAIEGERRSTDYRVDGELLGEVKLGSVLGTTATWQLSVKYHFDNQPLTALEVEELGLVDAQIPPGADYTVRDLVTLYEVEDTHITYSSKLKLDW